MKMNFVLDWLEFTYKRPSEEGYCIFDSFLEDFPEIDALFDEMKLLDHGMHGYTNCFTFTDDFMIWFNPDHEEMGVHVVFPGHGMYKLCEIFNLPGLEDFADAKALFDILSNRHCKVTRIDIAYDDFEKVITPHDYNNFMSNGRIRTRARCWSFISSGQRVGGTFYLGRRGNDRFIRIYDKDFESDGKINSIRYEFELRGDWASKIIDLVSRSDKFYFSDLIQNYMEVVEEYDTEGSRDVVYSRKYRSNLDEKWEKFLQLCGKVVDSEPVDLKIPRKKTEYTLKHSLEWLSKQVAPTLFMMHESIGIDNIIDIINSARNRLKPQQIAVIKKYIAERRQYEDWIEKLNKIGI